MAQAIMQDVFEFSEATGNPRLVLLSIADNADKETRLSHPSFAQMAKDANCSVSTAQRAVKSLADLGEIRKIEQGGIRDGQNFANVYEVACWSDPGRPYFKDQISAPSGGYGQSDHRAPVTNQPSLYSHDEETEKGGRSSVTKGQDDGPALPEGVTSDDYEPMKRVGGKRVSSIEWSVASSALAEFNHLLDRKFKLTAWVEKIVRRMREHPELSREDHVSLVQRACAKPWWKGEPSPAVIWGNPQVFDGCMNARAPREEDDWGRRPRHLDDDSGD